MTNLIRSETIKLTSIRAPWLLLAGICALAALGSGVVLFLDTPVRDALLSEASAQRTLLSIAPGGLMALVLGVLIGTGDHRHGTVTPTLIAAPIRHRVLAAKAVVTTGAALVMGVATGITLAVTGAAVILARGGEIAVGVGDVAEVWGRGAVVLVASGLLGLGIGEAVRNQVGAMVGTLVALTVVAPLVSGLLPGVGWYLPNGLEQVMMGAPADAPFGPPVAGLLYAAYAAVALGTGAGVLARRDVT